MKKKDKYWYFTTEWCCVLCGRVIKYKERRYTSKPKSPGDRIIYYDDACHDHFM